MYTTDILVGAQAASTASGTNSGEGTAGSRWPDDLSPNVETMTLEELDAGGSEFSWSTAASKESTPIAVEGGATSKTTSGEGAAVEEEAAPEPSIQKHSLYFWDSITFKVEGVVFQLPKYRFMEESEEFMGMVVGDKPGEPIELDVALEDFEGFLKAFLPRASAMYAERPTLSQDEWISVLKLSTLWLFNDLRKLAITHLSLTEMDAIDRICLAKEYKVYDWLLQGYEQIVERLLTLDDPDGEPMTLTAEEGQRIGMEVALELSGIVIRRMRKAERNVLFWDVKSDVKAAFRDEFYNLRKEGERFRTKSELIEEDARRWQQVKEQAENEEAIARIMCEQYYKAVAEREQKQRALDEAAKKEERKKQEEEAARKAHEEEEDKKARKQKQMEKEEVRRLIAEETKRLEADIAKRMEKRKTEERMRKSIAEQEEKAQAPAEETKKKRGPTEEKARKRTLAEERPGTARKFESWFA